MGKWLLLGISAVVAWRGWESIASSVGGLGHAVLTEELTLVGPAVLIAVALAMVAEHRWPAVARPLGSSGQRHDAAYLAVYVVVAVPAVVLLGTGFAAMVFSAAPWLVIH